MPQRETLAVTGYRDLMRGLQQADRESKREVRASLRKIGDVVRKDATSRFSPVSSHSAAGYRTRVRQKGIAVEQSLRKTTGRHPEYGGLQMRKALLPALMSNADDMNRQLEHALDVVCSRFNHGGHQWTG